MRKVVCLIALSVVSPSWCYGATAVERVQAAAQSGKHTYVMFYGANDHATQQMAKTIKTHVVESSDVATWVAVNVNRSVGSPLVEQFDATRIPLPAVFGLAPNGAVTCVSRLTVKREALERGIVTPKYASMVKALQDQKIAVICLNPAGSNQVPAGVKQFQNDPHFKGRTFRVNASAGEAVESIFFERMRVQTDITEPVVVLFAPPGVYLGTYNARVSGVTLAKKVHESGQCDCEHCQANH